MLELLADGRPGQEIVETLVTSRRSVREHLVSILLKLAVDDRRRSTAGASAAVWRDGGDARAACAW